MREIKFRAWDKEDKVMREIKRIDFSEKTIHILQTYLNEMKMDSVELMQYTGLSDKNGKEIYEGDIVRISVPKEDTLETHDIFEVVFDDGCFCLKMKEGNYALCEYLHQDCEVTGSIYENKDLI